MGVIYQWKKMGGAANLIFYVLLVMFINGCVERDDTPSSISRGGAQVEIVNPSNTSNVEEMQEYNKAHPQPKEKKVMPMPGGVAETAIDQ